MRDIGGSEVIELRLRSVAQLFHTLDPSPFREGDLCTEAEDYILGWAQELPPKRAIRIVVHLTPSELARPEATALPESIRRFFAGRARREAHDIRELFRSGRSALVIGLAILACCLFLALKLSEGPSEGGFRRVLEESLVIVGWVAIWRPSEIFLYDWLPMARRRALLRRLAGATVELRASFTGTG
jgi:hypothetical protein